MQQTLLNKIIIGVCSTLLIFVLAYFKESADNTTRVSNAVSVLEDQTRTLNKATTDWVEVVRALRVELVHLQVKDAEKAGEIKVLQTRIDNLNQRINDAHK